MIEVFVKRIIIGSYLVHVIVSVKNSDIKNRTYYSFDDQINKKNLNSNKIKIEKSDTKIFLFIISDM